MKSCSRYPLFIVLALVMFGACTTAIGKTVYVHLIDGDDRSGNGSYERPFRSWRVALHHVSSGDTVIAKNGDYRKAGREAKWGGLDLILTLEDPLQEGDPGPATTARPDSIGIYRYDPQKPLTIRAESKYGVVLDHVRFHLASGIVIDGFDIFPNTYY